MLNLSICNIFDLEFGSLSEILQVGFEIASGVAVGKKSRIGLINAFLQCS